MSILKEIQIPDIGGATDVAVIEILVNIGDRVDVEDPLITLESDKATMEVPSSDAGIVKEILVSVDDKVQEGSVIMRVEVTSAEQPAASAAVPEVAPAAVSSEPTTETVSVPDIGGADDVAVIEVLVKAGDTVAAEDALLTLESDKATMEVPSPFAGTVKEVLVAVGDNVKEGSDIVVLDGVVTASSAKPATTSAPSKTASAPTPAAASKPAPLSSIDIPPAGTNIHAGPAVRRIAREFGVDMRRVKGSGRKARVTVDDVRLYVKSELAKTQSGQVGSGLPVAPVVDFAKFGEVDTLPLTRIQKLSSKGLHRNWLIVPHVTQFDEVDITELEAFRKKEKAGAEKQGFKLTPLVFIMKAVVAALQEYPRFNSSLAADGENLVMKKYFHIGVAVDTPDGLVVPVVRDVDQKDLFQLAKELGEISVKARDGKLKPADMQGGCFTISSLGGIGGTAFTPIVNVPEVAILGVSRSAMKPVYKEGAFVPRLMLPLSLSYDHRVVDGAVGARFITHVNKCLSDLRLLLL